MFDLITMGEMLLRYSPKDGKRLINAAAFDMNIGGAELNVAAGAAQLGLKTALISKIPSNGLGELARRSVAALGVDGGYILSDNDKSARLGAYFYEYGSYPRKPEVIYDRSNTSFQKLDVSTLPNEVFSSAKCFHTSGINLALGGEIREQTIKAIKAFKENGALISFDVNFRGNLWSGEHARECIESLLPLVDIFFCSEDTARLTFNKTGSTEEIMRDFAAEYGISYVCSSKRTVESAARHHFSAAAYNSSNDSFFEGKGCAVDVVDRIGSGDAYVSGVLYGLLSGGDIRSAVQYGEAMGAMKCTVCGDICPTTKQEIDEMIAEQQTGAFSELKR